ncbi:MAG: tig [Oscillospiraceae bacterium]|jgi:trigger factor|nr:tig [Oscillospiraceae bacterium]
MSLTSSNKIETNKYELIIAVDAEKFEQGIQQTFRKNVSKINVPGFRKGKAPRKMVEKLYGESMFFEDAINALYPVALQEAVQEAGLNLVDRPEVEVTEVSKENGFTFKATCITKPEVEVKDYKGIKVEKTVQTVSDEDIDAEIKKMQDRNGRIISVDDRAAQDGDNTVIDFEGFVDGVAFDGGKGENFNLTLGSGQFIPGFEEQIVGHNIGEEFDVNVSFPENYHVEELKAKPAVFKVKLHEIKSKELPELDDEFAKDVSEFDTLAELREDITKKLDEANQKSADEQVENQLIETVIANMTAEIPEVMFESRIDDSVKDFEYRLQSQGLNLETYLQYTGMEMDSFRKTFAEQAEKQVKIRLALEKIAELENIEVSKEGLDAEYEKMAANYNMEVEKLKGFIPEEDLSKDLSVNKAIDLIKESAVVAEAKPAKKTAAKAPKSADKEDSEKEPAKKTTKKTTTKKTAKTEE